MDLYLKYCPSSKEIENINKFLEGYFDGNAIGVSYFPTKSIEQAIYDYIHTHQLVSDNIIEAIARNNSCIANLNSVMYNFDNFSRPENYINDVVSFLKELQKEVKLIDICFSSLEFIKTEIEIFHHFVAKTAPILYYMGFEDAVPHAAQVARKNAIEAFKKSEYNEECLKAAMVGWFHDPKIKSSICYTNVATHPVIAGSMAYKIINSADIDELLEDYLGDKMSIDNFKRGIVEPLFINNDSKYVLENVILYKKVQTSCAPNFNLADIIPEIKGIAMQRFNAPSLGLKPKLINTEVVDQLKEIDFETGIRLIKTDKIVNAYEKNAVNIGKEVHEQFRSTLLFQHPNDENVLKTLKNIILEEEKPIIGLTVKAISLFCHHGEVSTPGRIAASALVVSDPLLLSPHKILLTSKAPTPVERIKDFIASFNDNIQFVPLEAKEDSKIWQRDLYISMLKSARELVGLEDFHETMEDVLSNSIEDQIILLEEIISSSDTWGEYAEFDLKNDEEEKLFKMADIIKSNYDKSVENSFAMFNVTHLI